MKTIASLTMIYLPSTFAASIFSTGFFSYDVQGGSELIKVNPQIWKMFAVALAMSFLTIAIWVYLNKKGTPRIFDWARQLPANGKDDSSATSYMPAMVSGALGIANDKAVPKDEDGTKTGLSRPKISLPVPIDGDMA